MDNYSKIAALIKKIAGTHNDNSNALIFSAEVKSVSGQVCEIIANDIILSDVRLCSIVDDNHNNFIVKPKIASQVLVLDLTEGELRDLVVIKNSEIDTITINGGNLGGLVKIKELTTQLKKITNRIDIIIKALNNATTAAQDGGAAYKAGIIAILSSITEKEDFSDIEDEKILH